MHCSICLGPAPLGTLTPCGHCFHTACMAQWTAVNKTCPTCRDPVPRVQEPAPWEEPCPELPTRAMIAALQAQLKRTLILPGVSMRDCQAIALLLQWRRPHHPRWRLITEEASFVQAGASISVVWAPAVNWRVVSRQFVAGDEYRTRQPLYDHDLQWRSPPLYNPPLPMDVLRAGRVPILPRAGRLLMQPRSLYTPPPGGGASSPYYTEYASRAGHQSLAEGSERVRMAPATYEPDGDVFYTEDQVRSLAERAGRLPLEGRVIYAGSSPDSPVFVGPRWGNV